MSTAGQSSKPKWYFPELPDASDIRGMTDYSSKFGIQQWVSLMREICQNSLDEADGSGRPVEVEFSFEKIKRQDYPEIFADIPKFIKGAKASLGGGREGDRNFLKDTEAVLDSEEIEILVMRDFKTNGLTKIGEKTGGTWGALIRSQGFSHKSNNGAAGSKGVGKTAALACSRARMIFYNTRSQEGVGFQGRFGLPPLVNEESRSLDTPGHFCVVEENNRIRPIYPHDNCSFRDRFSRGDGQLGTDVIAIGVREEGDRTLGLRESAVINFFPAILNENLVVRISEEESGERFSIDKNSIEAEISSLIKLWSEMEDSKEKNKKMEILKGVQRMVNAMKTQPPLKLSVNEEADNVFLWHMPCEGGSSVLYTRATGMKILERSVVGMKPFVAVACVQKGNLNEKLRLAESEAHDNWVHKGQPPEVQKARKAIFKEVEDFIRENYEEDLSSISADSGLTGSREGENTLQDTDPLSPFSEIKKISEIQQGPKTDTSSTEGQGTKTPPTPPGPPPTPPGPPPTPPGPNPPIDPTPTGGTRGITKKKAVFSSRVFGYGEGVFKIVIKALTDISDLNVRFYPEGEDTSIRELPLCFKFVENSGEISKETFSGLSITMQKNESRKFVVKFEDVDDLDFNHCAIRMEAVGKAR